jgi:hypothetical protein
MLSTLIAGLTLITLEAIRGAVSTVSPLIARLTFVTLEARSNARSYPLLESFDFQL